MPDCVCIYVGLYIYMVPFAGLDGPTRQNCEQDRMPYVHREQDFI